MELFGEQFLKAERYLFLSFKNARKCARKIGTFSAQKWAKSYQNSKKTCEIRRFLFLVSKYYRIYGTLEGK